MQTSVREAMPQIGWIVAIVVMLGLFVLAAKLVVFEQPGATMKRVTAAGQVASNGVISVATMTPEGYQVPAVVDAQRQEPEVIIVTATPTSTPEPTQTPYVVQEVVYEPVYYDVPVEVEVTRIVEVTAVPLPTMTPVPLAPGTVQVCVDGAGLREIYVDQVGIVGGGCQIFQVGKGSTYVTVQVNR